MESVSEEMPNFDLSAQSAELIGCPGGYCFEAIHRGDASIVWVNRRWFKECGWNIDSAEDYRRVEKVLLEQFAYVLGNSSRRATDASKCDVGYLIDSYGTTSLTRYSGSGRAGIINGLQVKGIGLTPLAAPDADWHHSHGFLWIEEGIREAVFSEVCRVEAPCSAVPVIAVIGLEEEILSPTGERRRRALLVRPFRVRPAHLQRALLSTHQSHLCDVARVRWHIKQLDGLPGGAWATLGQLADSLGRQAAYSHCFGWFNGGLTSSNITLHGEIIDFGSARYVPDLFASSYGNLGQRFGDEIETSLAVLNSVSFYISKYSQPSKRPIEFLGRLMFSYRKELLRSTLRILGGLRFIVEDSIVLACIENSIEGSRNARDGSAAKIVEEQAMAQCAEWAQGPEGCQPGSSMERWRARRYRELGSREAIEAAINSSLSEGVSCQLLTDGLISRLLLLDVCHMKVDSLSSGDSSRDYRN